MPGEGSAESQISQSHEDEGGFWEWFAHFLGAAPPWSCCRAPLASIWSGSDARGILGCLTPTCASPQTQHLVVKRVWLRFCCGACHLLLAIPCFFTSPSSCLPWSEGKTHSQSGCEINPRGKLQLGFFPIYIHVYIIYIYKKRLNCVAESSWKFSLSVLKCVIPWLSWCKGTQCGISVAVSPLNLIKVLWGWLWETSNHSLMMGWHFPVPKEWGMRHFPGNNDPFHHFCFGAVTEEQGPVHY